MNIETKQDIKSLSIAYLRCFFMTIVGIVTISNPASAIDNGSYPFNFGYVVCSFIYFFGLSYIGGLIIFVYFKKRQTIRLDYQTRLIQLRRQLENG